MCERECMCVIGIAHIYDYCCDGHGPHLDGRVGLLTMGSGLVVRLFLYNMPIPTVLASVLSAANELVTTLFRTVSCIE